MVLLLLIKEYYLFGILFVRNTYGTALKSQSQVLS